jgi:hypothetical protein
LPNHLATKDQKPSRKREGLRIGEHMSEYFVAGGTYKNHEGEERFDLGCPGPGEPPYVMIAGVMDYFRLVWQNAHLYRVEDDYSLTLVAPSPEALQLGVQAPERVTPGAALLEQLQKVICHQGSVQSGSCQSWRLN